MHFSVLDTIQTIKILPIKVTITMKKTFKICILRDNVK